MKNKLNYSKYFDLENKYKLLVDRIASIRLMLFIIMIISFIFGYYYGIIFKIISVVSFISFVILIIIHDKYFKLYDYYCKYTSIINEYGDRENGKWRKFLDNGEDFLDDKRAFLEDLDVFGKDSLFQYLNTCKTIGGRRVLAKKLSNNKMTASKLKEEQEAVIELVDNVDFDINFQIALMNYQHKNVDLSSDVSLLHNSVNSKSIDIIIAFILSFISLVVFVMGILGAINIRFFYVIFIFNYLISFIYSFIFKKFI